MGLSQLTQKNVPDVKIQKVDKFIEWLTSEETKLLISEFKVNNKRLFSRKVELAMINYHRPDIHQYLYL